MTTFPTTVPQPSFPLSKKVTPSVFKVQFGDGYSQRMRKGINNIKSSWSLVWNDLTQAQALTIDNFLQGQGGMSFYWTAPNEVAQRLVSCSEDWEVSFQGPDLYNVTASFIEEIL